MTEKIPFKKDILNYKEAFWFSIWHCNEP